MCALCLQTPCHPRCPNAPEREPIKTCVRCDEGILAGDKYFGSEDGSICEECMDGMKASEILELLGEELKTAEKE